MKNKKNLLLGALAVVAFIGVSVFMTSLYLERKVETDGMLAANTSINANVNAGTLSISAPGSANMSDIDLDAIEDGGGSSTGTIAGIKIKDHRGASPGWSATMTCVDFTDGDSNKIPITDFTVTPGTPTAVGSSSITGVRGGEIHTFESTSDPATIITASTGNGRGRFNIDVGLELAIDVSTVPASYSSTCIETVS